MIRKILVDDTHELFQKSGLNYIELTSDYRQIRYFTLLLVKHSRPRSDERLLLEQQVSELIKNAVKHGNNCNPEKLVRVWYRFTDIEARMIVSDEGPGFTDLEKWNIFHEKREGYINKGDYESLLPYASWRTARSDKFDGGNALFAAVEYWNRGVVFSGTRNTVAVGKSFHEDVMHSEDDL